MKVGILDECGAVEGGNDLTPTIGSKAGLPIDGELDSLDLEEDEGEGIVSGGTELHVGDRLQAGGYMRMCWCTLTWWQVAR